MTHKEHESLYAAKCVATLRIVMQKYTFNRTQMEEKEQAQAWQRVGEGTGPLQLVTENQVGRKVFLEVIFFAMELNSGRFIRKCPCGQHLWEVYREIRQHCMDNGTLIVNQTLE